MAREHETTTAAQQQSWGTLAELLLACAVNRHGTKRWDLIAMEVRTRSSTLSPLTPQSCKDKFDDLRRRFGFAATSQHDAESGGGFLVSMVDQLTRIRVQELRAEVERHDISIVSLELKVKRLEEKEERETSLKADTDLERETKASPEIIAGKFSAAEANSDDRDNRSFHESNSTTQKAETTTTKIQNDTILDKEEKEHRVKPESEAETEPVSGEPGRDRDWSSNGILNRTENVKDDNENDKTTSDGKTGSDDENKRSGAGGLSESNELWDESKGEGKEAGLRMAAAAASKQNSDVQSSASLSKTIQRRRSKGGGGGGGAAGCSSSEEVSPATKKVLAVKSEPLLRLLAMIRSHRLGSHFERRLRSQESERYKKLVKQHIDLRTIQSRLDRGLYSNCIQRFYRDLLLLFNNFIVFFKKTSQEHGAARELRAMVIKDMADKLEKPKPKSELPPISLSKPSKGSTMVVCGKRSSVKAISENASRKRGDKKEKEVEEKEKESPKVNEKKLGSEDKGVMKKRSNESKNSRGGSNNNNNKGDGEVIKHPYGNNELSSHDGNNVKLDKKEISVRKKQGAASFLRRMKQNSPKKVAEKNEENRKEKEKEEEDDDDDEDDDNDNDSESKDSRVEEDGMKKRRRGRNNNSNNNNNSSSSNKNKKKKKRDGRKERVTRSNSNWKGREENGRKGVGRPTKRSTAGARKRGRENGESEVGAVGKRTRR